jgi:hypothetical protein
LVSPNQNVMSPTSAWNIDPCQCRPSAVHCFARGPMMLLRWP